MYQIRVIVDMCMLWLVVSLAKTKKVKAGKTKKIKSDL